VKLVGSSLWRRPRGGRGPSPPLTRHRELVARLSAQSEGDKARGLLRVFIPQPDIKALNATGPRANTGPDVL
jgi:hypothetical protein